MKHILLTTVLTTSIITQIIAQDCTTLNNFNSLHGITFGQQVSDSIKKYFKFEMINGKNDSSSISYSLNQKKLMSDNILFDKFNNFFYFGGNIFSNFSAGVLPDGRVFELSLAKYHDKKDSRSKKDSIEIVNNKLPETFIKASYEISSLFGEMTNTKNENDNLGYHLYRIWDCEKNRVELSLWYWNTNNSMLSSFALIIDVSFINKELEKINKLWKYQNLQ